MLNSIKWTLIFSGLIFGVGQAHAINRAFVASEGADANTSTNCGPTTPCRTFNAALSVIDAGGEIIVKDSAGYGPAPINITKSVSIIAPSGVYAGVSVAGSTTGITISDPSASGVSVVLKGLTINSLGTVGNGISMTGGASLIVEGCTIMGFSATNAVGIAVVGPINARIADTTVRNGYTGVAVEAGATATITNLHLFNFSNAGVYVTDAGGTSPAASSAAVTIADVNNVGQGAAVAFWAYSTSSSAEVDVDQVSIVGGGQGVRATSTSSADTALALVTSSYIAKTTTGVQTDQWGPGGTSQITFSGTTFNGNITGAANDTGGTIWSDSSNLFIGNLNNLGVSSTQSYISPQ